MDVVNMNNNDGADQQQQQVQEQQRQRQRRQQRLTAKIRELQENDGRHNSARTKLQTKRKSVEILQRHAEFPVRQREEINIMVCVMLDYEDLGEENEIANDVDDDADVDVDVDVDTGVGTDADADADVGIGAGADADADNGNHNDASARATRRRLNLIKIFQRYTKRILIDMLVEWFMDDLGDDIHKMLCDMNRGVHYQGLDIERDTVSEVKTAIGFFPELLSQRGGSWNLYPINCLSIQVEYRFNFKAIPFIAILARLGNEFNQFTVEQCGGLLIEYNHSTFRTFKYLVRSSLLKEDDEGYNQRVDIVFQTLLTELRQIGLFKKEYISDHNLVLYLCNSYNEEYFAANRFRLLVEWNPTSLLQIAEHNGWLPLHYAALRNSIEGFKLVFNYAIRYYPIMKGIHLLYTKSYLWETPFQIACHKYGRDKVMNIVDDTLTQYSPETPLHSVEALIVAASDRDIHFDCVYFLLRREPDLVLGLLPGFTNNNNNNDGTNDGTDGDNEGNGSDANNDDGDDDDVDINHNVNLDDDDDGDDDDDDLDNYIGPNNNSDDNIHDNGGVTKNNMSGDTNNTNANDRKRKRGS